MIRRVIRPAILIFTLALGSSLVWYSVASADDPVAPATNVVAVDTVDTVATAPMAPATPVVVVASEPPKVQSPAIARIIDIVIDVMAAILLILVPYFIHRLLAYFEKKTGIKLALATKEKIDALLDKGIAFAEEQGHKVVKAKAKALTMPEKLEFGAGYVMDLADHADVKGWTIEKVKKMLEARLNETRTPPSSPPPSV